MAERSGSVVAVYLDGRAPPDVADLHARMGMLTAFLGCIIFEVDHDARYLSVLTGEANLLARPVESLRGVSFADVLGPEQGGKFMEMFLRVLATGTPGNLDYTLKIAGRLRTFRCEARLSPSSKTKERTPTVTLLVHDITEETELRAKLLEAERLAAMGLVAASVGHEIRQPLAFATTSLEVLARELARAAGPSERTREALDHVRDAIRRIAGIAANVGVVAPDRHRDTTTDVRRPIEAAIDLCASELQRRARVKANIPDLPKVRANEGELCQVITNLLLNAAQAVDADRTPTNRITITASLHEDGTKVQISVADDGCGIDPANVARVFDPFFTTKAPGTGTGLGLFVSKRIVEQAGGVLEIQSKLERGTTVLLTLPVASSEISVAPSEPFPTPRRMTVLVIDDEPAFLRSLELVLEDTHDVVVCNRSTDALALVRGDPAHFDAILCDLSMPEIDGVAFYDQMEALGVAHRFVLMTAGAFTPHGEEFIRQAKCRRIAKPFTFDKLLSVLGAVTARA